MARFVSGRHLVWGSTHSPWVNEERRVINCDLLKARNAFCRIRSIFYRIILSLYITILKCFSIIEIQVNIIVSKACASTKVHLLAPSKNIHSSGFEIKNLHHFLLFIRSFSWNRQNSPRFEDVPYKECVRWNYLFWGSFVSHEVTFIHLMYSVRGLIIFASLDPCWQANKNCLSHIHFEIVKQKARKWNNRRPWTISSTERTSKL